MSAILVVADNGPLIALARLDLLVRSRELNLVPALRPLLDVLVGSGYHVAPGLVERALAAVGE